MFKKKNTKKYQIKRVLHLWHWESLHLWPFLNTDPLKQTRHRLPSPLPTLA